MSEDREQMQLIQWAKTKPWGELLLHIPNENTSGAARGARNKAMGVRSGVPDLLLPVPRSNYHGLWIELKTKQGVLSVNQKVWIGNLNNLGYKAVVAYGWEHAKKIIEDYMNGTTASNT